MNANKHAQARNVSYHQSVLIQIMSATNACQIFTKLYVTHVTHHGYKIRILSAPISKSSRDISPSAFSLILEPSLGPHFKWNMWSAARFQGDQTHMSHYESLRVSTQVRSLHFSRNHILCAEKKICSSNPPALRICSNGCPFEKESVHRFFFPIKPAFRPRSTLCQFEDDPRFRTVNEFIERVHETILARPMCMFVTMFVASDLEIRSMSIIHLWFTTALRPGVDKHLRHCRCFKLEFTTAHIYMKSLIFENAAQAVV